MRVLDVGCGPFKRPGAVGIDISPTSAADLVWDLNRYPYPLRESSFDLIICNHIVEHVEDVFAFLRELHRVARPGASVRLLTPHYSNRYSFADPSHRHHLSLASLDYFVRRTSQMLPTLLERAFEANYPVPDFYLDPLFEKASVHLSFGRPFRLTGIGWLANRFPNIYESYFAFLFPGRDLTFELRVIK